MAQPQQFHGMQQQQQRPVMMMQGRQQQQPGPGSGHAAGFGRRDARHDPYLAPRASNMINARYQHHNGRAGGGGGGLHGQQQQFFVNGNPSGVNCPPQQQSRMGAAHGHGHAGAFHGSNGPVVEAFLPRHAAGGVTGGVAMAPTPTFSSRVGGGAGAVVVPRSSAVGAGGGGGHMPVPFQVGNSSQFSMWRSQVVFAPVMQMQ